MGEKELLKALEDDARRECSAIIENAMMEADTIVKGIAEEMEKIKKEGLEKVNALMQMERVRRLAKARLDARGIVLKERDAGIKKVLDSARVRLKEMHKEKDYPLILERLLREAVDEWNNSMKSMDARVIASREDIPILKNLKSSGCYEIVPDDKGDVSSGVVIMSKDRRFRIVNTLHSRLEKAGTEIVSIIDKVLYK